MIEKKEKEDDELIITEKIYSSGLYSLKGVRIEKGKGVYLYDDMGNKYLDFMSGHGVACLGHSHPALIKAIREQSEKIITLHASFPTSVRAKFYKLMAEITPKNLTKTFIVNSGTEAVEAALKLAMAYRRDIKNPNIIAMKRSFHGRTMGSLSLTFNPKYRVAFQSFLSKNVRFASFNNIDSIKSMVDENTIAIITELVQGEGGVYPATKEFAQELREFCNEKGLLLIIDEVQTGFGRTGNMFAYEGYNIEPDILCCAKGIAGGVPMGAIVSSEEIFSKIKNGEHASTFGGNPLAVAASVATINELKDKNIPENAAKMGKLINTELLKYKEMFSSVIREVRGKGLLIGLQFKQKAVKYINYSFQHGVIFIPAGMTVLRMLPPLIINQEHVKIALDTLHNALSS
ncbi:MAG: aspartate aminotransferase family protein [Promethearchaeota archaeon]